MNFIVDSYRKRKGPYKPGLSTWYFATDRQHHKSLPAPYRAAGMDRRRTRYGITYLVWQHSKPDAMPKPRRLI